jgi:hypothetical protein
MALGEREVGMGVMEAGMATTVIGAREKALRPIF